MQNKFLDKESGDNINYQINLKHANLEEGFNRNRNNLKKSESNLNQKNLSVNQRNFEFNVKSFIFANFDSFKRMKNSSKLSLTEKLYNQAINFKNEINSNIENGLEWAVNQVSNFRNKSDLKLTKSIGELAYSKNFGQIA